MEKKTRLIFLFLSLIILIIIGRIATSSFEFIITQFWFTSGLLLLILLSLIDQPHFSKDSNIFVNSVAAWMSLLIVQTEKRDNVWWIFFVITTYLIISSYILMWIRKKALVNENVFIKFFSRINREIGKPETIFSAFFLWGAVRQFGLGTNEFDGLLLYWTVFMLLNLPNISKAIESLFKKVKKEVSSTGFIQRIDSPDLIRVNLQDSSFWNINEVQIACFYDSQQKYILPLFKQLNVEGLIGTGLCIGNVKNKNTDYTNGYTYLEKGLPSRLELLKEFTGLGIEMNIVGFIVENSSVSTIEFEIATELELKTGLLIFCLINNKVIYYQILDACTTEESFEKNPRGTHIVSALQLGELNKEKGFIKYPWLPNMNTPVFLSKNPLSIEETKLSKEYFIVGKIPETNLSISLNFNELVEYHGAILGVTGKGKTELSFDIIRHALKNETKVFCVDFTEEYKERLKDLNPQILGLNEDQNKKLDELIINIETGDFSAAKEKKAYEDYIKTIKPDVQKKINDFLTEDGSALAIFELPEIANTRSTLKATELYLSEIFNWARKNRKARKILLVLEEAHTIIPEMNLFSYDKSDTLAVIGRISQIALQGRKYGVGLLLLSQRTALVSKTVLSQCNTYFTFSLIDKTSLDYLSNVYSPQHISTIPNLLQYQLIVSGKAIRCERPVVIEIPYDENKKKASETLKKEIRKEENK